MVPKRNASHAVEDSAVVPSSKPIPSSAILTFVPDNEVKKIVTRPVVDNCNSPSTEKQMVLRDRRPAAQDSPFSRKRVAVVIDHLKTEEVALPNKEANQDKTHLGTAEENAEGVFCASTSCKAGVDTEGREGHSPEGMSKTGSGGNTEASASASEPGNESKIKEDQVPVTSASVPKDEVLSSEKSDDKTGMEIQPSTLMGQTVETGISVSESKTSTQAGSAVNSSAVTTIENKIGTQASSTVNSSAVTKTENQIGSEASSTVSSSAIAKTESKISVHAGSTVNSSTIKKTDMSPSLMANSSLGKPLGNDGKPNAASSDSPAKQNAMGASDTGSKVTTTKPEVEEPVFRLGSEGNYSSYVNQFTSNTLALNKQQHLEQRDKKRSVTHKFSLNEFKWHGDVYGSKDVILNTLRFSIVGLENSIPGSFMHPSWPVQRSTWVRAVHLSKTPQEFAAALSFLESSIRPICYLPVWNDAVGHVDLHRVMSEARHAATKKKDHKEEEEELELEHKGFGMYKMPLEILTVSIK